MSDRVTLLDGVCPRCRNILRREVVTIEQDVTTLKAEMVATGLITAHYTAVTPVEAALSHKPTCPRA